MLEFDFQNRPGYWICTTAQQFERAMNAELLPHGITFRQCQVLASLAIDGDLSQTELASRLRIEPPSLVPVLDRMERDGWVRRVPCPEDRRRKLIRPCAKAQPVWGQILACAERVSGRATEGLSAAEVKSLNRVLQRMTANLTRDESRPDNRR